MATLNVCRYFKFGFCKFTDMCKFMHVNQCCENPSCEIKQCNLRHPRICKFYRDYNRCKFGEWCAFKHVEHNDRSAESTREILEKIDKLAEIIQEKDDLINSLIEKMKCLEAKVMGGKEYLVENSSEDNQCEPCEKSLESVDVLHNQTETEQEHFKCDKCDFETKHEKGLNIHKKRKHGQKLYCDLCEEQFDSKRDMKIHRHEHSFTNKGILDQACNKCDFTSDIVETMEVHVGKGCSDNFECGLCDQTFENLEILEIHLSTCEVYECGESLNNECFYRDKHLSEMKKHLLDSHEKSEELLHLKIERKDPSKVSIKKYHISQL